ncbi:MAG: hypothetical protein H5U36_02005 [Candidatus Caldatribacterium sp.]|nr:hypothetical protein [Candidatus Caldatribacterium sp.]
MKEIAPGVTLLGYRIVRFTFDATGNREKSGWDVYPEITVVKTPEGKWEGNLTLTMNFFSEESRNFAVHLVAQAKFLGENIEGEKFATLCRSQGAALLVHPLRLFVQDFLSKVYP